MLHKTKLTATLSTLYLVLISVLTTYAQEADLESVKNFNQPVYIDAIEVYEKVIEDGRIEDEDLFIKIASAYYFKSDYNNASKWFERYHKINEKQPLPIYNYWYGQTLKALKNYKKADSLLAPYFEDRGERYIYSYQDSRKKNTDRYRIQSFEHNTNFSDYAAYLHKDRLYFISNHSNGNKLGWTNTYTSDVFFIDNSTNAIQNPQGSLNSKYNEGSLVITKDGRTMYFTRNAFLANKFKKIEKGEPKTIALNIYKAELTDGKWDKVEPLSINNPNYSVGHPALSSDDKTLYFSSDMPGGKGATDIYSVEIKENGNLGKPVNLEALNTIGRELFPFVDRSNGNLYFASDRPESLGGLDIFVSTIESDGNYRDAYNIGVPINSSYDDFAYMINAEKNGYFSSNKKEDKLDDIYAFVETTPFIAPIILEINGYTKNIETGKVVTNVEVTLYDKKDSPIETVQSDDKGYFQFSEKEIKNLNYIKAKKLGYLNSEISLSQKELENKNSYKDIKLLALTPNLSPTITLAGRLKDKDATILDKGLSNAMITLLDINRNTLAKQQTSNDGEFIFDNINRNNIAFLRIEKEGYLTKELDLNAKTKKGDNTNFNITLSKSRVKKEQGTNIASLLNTIYFDYGKSVIREDAKIELEKIVQVLNKYSEIKLHIGAHTDSQSSQAFNQKLSQKRAKSTYEYLISRKINATRLSYKGYGESKLLNKCKDGFKCSEAEHQENRRSEFIIVTQKDDYKLEQKNNIPL